MLTSKQLETSAEALYQAELTATPIEPISVTHEDATVEDAYAIAQLVTAKKVAGGRQIKGQKVGLTSKAMRGALRAFEPDYGTLFDNWFVDEGSIIPASRLNRPLVECEMTFVMKETLTGADVNAADVIRATDFVLPSIEIVDNRYNGRGSNGLVDSIADAASCGLVILGGNPVRLTDIDIRHVSASLAKNGEIEVSGMAAAVMGNPINSMAWLARKLHEFGVALEAGQVVLSGSFVAAVPFGAGDTFTADFGALGQISFGVSQD